MPSYCTAYKCCNNSNQGYALVRYPRDETLKKKWIAVVGRGKNWSPSSSQKLCEVHFKPLEIEFVAGRKRVKFNSVPSRFCTCSLEARENCSKNDKKGDNMNNVQEELMMDTSIEQLTVKEHPSRIKQVKIEAEHNYYRTYSTSDQRRTSLTTIYDTSSRNRCLTKKRVNVRLVQHQNSCVQICKPLIIKDIQNNAQSQEITKQTDGIQPVDENENLCRSIINKNEQLQNKVKETTVKDIVKVKKKIEKMDVKDMHRKIYEGNYKLKQQVKTLCESV